MSEPNPVNFDFLYNKKKGELLETDMLVKRLYQLTGNIAQEMSSKN